MNTSKSGDETTPCANLPQGRSARLRLIAQPSSVRLFGIRSGRIHVGSRALIAPLSLPSTAGEIDHSARAPAERIGRLQEQRCRPRVVFFEFPSRRGPELPRVLRVDLQWRDRLRADAYSSALARNRCQFAASRDSRHSDGETRSSKAKGMATSLRRTSISLARNIDCVPHHPHRIASHRIAAKRIAAHFTTRGAVRCGAPGREQRGEGVPARRSTVGSCSTAQTSRQRRSRIRRHRRCRW